MFRHWKNKLIAILMLLIMLILLPLDLLTKKVYAAESMKVGDYVQFGQYLGKPILWRVLANDKDGVTIMSDKIICFKPFDAAESGEWGVDNKSTGGEFKFGNPDWGKSNLREWLNSEEQDVKYSTVPPISKALFRATDAYDKEPGFLSNFTREEINNIKIHNTVYTNSQKTYTVADRIFLLDKTLEEKCKTIDSYPTKEAVEKLNWKGNFITTNTKCLFWRASLNGWHFPTSSGINLIWDEGTIQADGNGGGVVPILTLSSSNVKLGKGTEKEPYIPITETTQKIELNVENQNPFEINSNTLNPPTLVGE